MADFNWQTRLTAIDSDEGDTAAVVPPNLAPLYSKAEDGTFTLDPTLAKRLEPITGLSSALEKERKANREFDRLLKQYQKHGKPEELEARLQALAEDGAGSDKSRANFEKLKASMVEAHAKEKAELEGRVQAMRNSLDHQLIVAEATQAIAAEKGFPALLLPHIRAQVKVFEDNGRFVARAVDADGDPRGDGKGGYMGVRELVAEMKKSQDFAPAFAASGTTGSGMRPGQGGKPSQNKSSADKIRSGLENL